MEIVKIQQEHDIDWLSELPADKSYVVTIDDVRDIILKTWDDATGYIITDVLAFSLGIEPDPIHSDGIWVLREQGYEQIHYQELFNHAIRKTNPDGRIPYVLVVKTPQWTYYCAKSKTGRTATVWLKIFLDLCKRIGRDGC